MKAYQLSVYEYDTYSFSGISIQEMFIHLSKEGAISRAKGMGLLIGEFCYDPNKIATIDEIEIFE